MVELSTNDCLTITPVAVTIQLIDFEECRFDKTIAEVFS